MIPLHAASLSGAFCKARSSTQHRSAVQRGVLLLYPTCLWALQ